MRWLTKGIYGNVGQTGPFGLMCGQGGDDSIAHNGGWFNRAGERLGFGDLGVLDVRRIMVNLPGDELFIVLSEGDTCFLARPVTVDDKEAPGIEYVSHHARYVIARGQFYVVSNSSDLQDGQAANEPRFRKIPEATYLRRESVKALMTGELAL